MSPDRPDALDVHVTIAGTPVLAGTATFRYRGATTTTTFTYSRSFLARPDAYALDPALPLDGAPTVAEGLPAAFSDSTPDWWGRRLVTRRHQLEASAAGRQPPLLTEPDLLVGVSDATREGALRYALPGSTTFLGEAVGVPELLGLPELLEAADRVASDDDAGVLDALKTLLASGSGTLGGARPKASVRDGDELLIAKFPFREDEWDVIAWEATALGLAARCGVAVPDHRVVSIGRRHVLLLRRFDRAAGSDRIGYVSARTLAGASSSAGNDYLDLVGAIEDHSGATSRDLAELWLRVAVSVALNNTDDHFHNHGFCRSGRGWVLAPAFDINIDPQLARPRTTALNGATMRDDTLLALVRHADYFGLEHDEAVDGLHRVRDALADWRDLAVELGVPAGELDRVGWVVDDYRDRVAGPGGP